MIQALREFGVWVGTGPLAPLAIVLAFATALAALAILILELSGRTLSGTKIVRHKVRWDWKAVAVVIVTAIIIIAIQPIRFDFIQILRRGPRLAPSLAPVIAVIFGLPGVLGYLLGVFVDGLRDGFTAANLFATIWMTLSWVWITWLPYKMVGEMDFSDAGSGLRSLGRFYLWGVIVGPLLHVWASPVLQVLQGGEATAVWGRMVPMIAVNHDAPLLIVGPIAIAILYPLARLVHMYWPEREGVALAPA